MCWRTVTDPLLARKGCGRVTGFPPLLAGILLVSEASGAARPETVCAQAPGIVGPTWSGLSSSDRVAWSQVLLKHLFSLCV